MATSPVADSSPSSSSAAGLLFTSVVQALDMGVILRAPYKSKNDEARKKPLKIPAVRRVAEFVAGPSLSVLVVATLVGVGVDDVFGLFPSADAVGLFICHRIDVRQLFVPQGADVINSPRA